jgi:hypothetical protein
MNTLKHVLSDIRYLVGKIKTYRTSSFGNFIFVDGYKTTVSDICYICKTTIVNDDLIGVPDNCHHGFHLTCIEGWINRGNRFCPECGTPFGKIIKTPFKLER